MKDNKLPHFPFYARDWLTDTRVMLMDLATQGAYIKLLCYQWLEGGIPRDEKQLATLCGTTEEKFADIWPELHDAFEVVDEKLVNPRLEEIRGDAEERVAKAIKNGKKGAEKRWKGNKDSPPNSPPMADHSDPNAIQNQNQTNNQTQDDAASTPVSKSGEPFSKEAAGVFEQLLFTFGFGHAKAQYIAQELCTTEEDLRDWTLYERAKGTKLTRHHMKRFKNPRDIPQEVVGTDESNKRKTFAQMDEDDYAKKKAEFDKEQGDSDVSRDSEGA